MEIYRIEARQAPHGWVLKSSAFGLTVDAGPDELDVAMQALKRLIDSEAQRILDAGGFLPSDKNLAAEDFEDGMRVLYLETDFENRFVAKTSETVRRNISMPAWMDLRLRKNGVDASKLFQDAATKKLEELDQVRGGTGYIADVDELMKKCPEKVLDEYFRERLMQKLGIDAKRED